MKTTLSIAIAALLPALAPAQVVVNDSWGDAGRSNGADPFDAAWWSSTSTGNNSVEAGSGYMGLVTGSSGRGLHGTFTPQTLAVGDLLTATFRFTTPTTVGSGSSGGLRFALADFNNAGLAADLASGSAVTQPLFQSLPAYMVDFDINVVGIAEDTSVREHIVPEPAPNSNGRFMGTTATWNQLGTSTDVDYAFTPNTEYTVVMSLHRTGADTMSIFGSLSQGSTLLTSGTQTDVSGIVNNIGLIGVWVNSGLFGSANTIGAADNGLDFLNISVTIVPEPSTAALIFAGMFILGLGRRARA